MYILQHLRHPNIIRLVNYVVRVEYDMSIYLLYESGKKGSLEDIKKQLRHNKMHSAIKLIMYELAEALSYLKSVNVAHRDIKVNGKIWSLRTSHSIHRDSSNSSILMKLFVLNIKWRMLLKIKCFSSLVKILLIQVLTWDNLICCCDPKIPELLTLSARNFTWALRWFNQRCATKRVINGPMDAFSTN